MSECTTEIKGDLILIRSPFAMKDQIKALPGATWNRKRRIWTLPATAAGSLSAISLAGTHSDEVVALSARLKRVREKIKNAKLPEPKYSKLAAWHHQVVGYNLIINQTSTMLAWEMGVGKTKAAVDAICNLSDCSAVLVICPKTVIDVWPAEFEKHSDIQVVAIPLRAGSIAKRMADAEIQLAVCKKQNKKVVIIINYEAVWREPMAGFVASVEWDMIVADESHRIKSAKSKASRFLARLKAKRKVAMTGTPMPHSPMDAFGQYRFLDPGIFGTSLVRFRDRYAEMGGYMGKAIVGFKNQDELHRKFYSIGHRVRKDDVLDLPPVIHETRLFDLCKEAAKAYGELERQFIADVGAGIVTASNALTRLLRLQQMTSGFAVIESGESVPIDEGKYHALVDLIGDLDKKESIVVFCRFRKDLESVHIASSELSRDFFELSGKRNQLAEWKEHGGILAVQIQAGGVGIDLTKAAYCVYYSVGFSLGDYLQSMARLDRHGQTRSVTYIHLLARGTIDETVRKSLAAKKKVVDDIIDNMKGAD